MVGASEPLRIGLLVDTLQQPAWVRQIIADIQASQYARIVLVIKKDGPPKARVLLRVASGEDDRGWPIWRTGGSTHECFARLRTRSRYKTPPISWPRRPSFTPR